MWKLARNMVLLTAALAAALFLLLWVAAQQQAGAIAAQLAPWVDLRYASASAGFDGSLRLHDVSLQPRHGGAGADPWHARELRLDAGGPLWLLARAVTRGDAFPPESRIEAADVRLPQALQTATAGWLDPRSHIPFDAFGCGGALTDKDYAAMQGLPQPLWLSLSAQRDAPGQELQLDLRVRQTPLADLRFRLDLKPFDFGMLDDAKALSALRVASASLDYHDQGYFAARNRHCAERLGGSIEGYLDRHLHAVGEFLAAHDVVPAKEVADLYRELLFKGGEVELVSLPNAAVAPASYAGYERAEVLRYLNLTARHDSAPPILFKLTFLAPVEPEEGVLASSPAAEAAAPATGTPTATGPSPPLPSSPAAATASAATAPVAKPIAPEPKPVAIAPPAAPVPAPSTEPKPAAKVPTTVAAAPTVPPATTAEAPIAAEEKLRDPATGKPLSSVTPPPGNSTLSLLWKSGTVERLPVQATEVKPYTVVEAQALENYVGQRVTLVTEGGKTLEGVLDSVDGEEVVLQMRRETGSAALNVPRRRIREVRIPRSGSHD